MFTYLLCFLILSAVLADDANNMRTMLHMAKATIYSATDFGTENLGELTFIQYREELPSLAPSLHVEITGELKNILPGGKHGFHIHTNPPNDELGCDACENHYNPLNVNHGAPTDVIRHVGDLGNIKSGENGAVHVHVRDCIIQIGTQNATYDIVGRGVVIHSGRDDLGLGGNEESKKTGNAGTKIACGTIVLESPPPTQHAPISGSPSFSKLSMAAAMLSVVFGKFLM